MMLRPPRRVRGHGHASPPAPPGARKERVSSPVPGQAEALNVAFVEDDPATRQAFSMLVGGTPGLRCVAAWGSVEEALQRTPAAPPAVILLDIGLPDAVGTSTLEWLQTLRPDIPVIVLTGNTDQRLARQMRQRGAFDYITKPFEIEHLERSLQAAVSTASP